MKKNITSLTPIESPSSQSSASRAKNSWATSIHYLQDLKTNKQRLFNQLQLEMQALYSEQDKTVEEQQAMKTELMRKVEKINHLSSSADKIRALTGFNIGVHDPSSDTAITRDLFQLVAMLEIYSQAYLEADQYFSRQVSLSSVTKPPKDRLICYLQLIKSIKKPQRGTSQKQQLNESASSGARSDSRGRKVNFQEWSQSEQYLGIDFSSKEDLMKLKGTAITEAFINYIVKNFGNKSSAVP